MKHFKLIFFCFCLLVIFGACESKYQDGNDLVRSSNLKTQSNIVIFYETYNLK